jgi:hypothetical protein
MKSLALNEIASLKRSKHRASCCYDTSETRRSCSWALLTGNRKSDKNKQQMTSLLLKRKRRRQISTAPSGKRKSKKAQQEHRTWR